MVALLIGVFAINLLYRAWRSRIHHKFYAVTRDGERFKFQSDLGEFVLDRQERTVSLAYIDGRRVKLDFANVRNIELITEDKEASFQEFFLEGYNVFIDSDSRFRDLVKRYSIFVVTNDFKHYPLIVLQQYEVRDFLNIAVDVQLGLLELLGLYMPVNAYAESVYGQFKDFLGREFLFDREKI